MSATFISGRTTALKTQANLRAGVRSVNAEVSDTSNQAADSSVSRRSLCATEPKLVAVRVTEPALVVHDDFALQLGVIKRLTIFHQHEIPCSDCLKTVH